jgi:hypothetical protein
MEKAIFDLKILGYKCIQHKVQILNLWRALVLLSIINSEKKQKPIFWVHGTSIYSLRYKYFRADLGS